MSFSCVVVAFLIHGSIDDVEDESVLRRGVPAAHHIYGTPQTINCANYVYFLALNEIAKLNKANMITIYTGGCCFYPLVIYIVH